MNRPPWLAPALGAAAFIGVLYLLGRAAGLLVGVVLVVLVKVGVRPRELIVLAGVLIALVPLSMLRQGLITAETLSPNIIPRYGLANNIAFAGFVFLVVGVALDCYRRRAGVDDESQETS